MGESLLAAYLQPLLDKLASGPLMNFARQMGFHSDLREWRSKLRQIKLVLGDAEEKQMNDIEVKRWLDELLVLAYDADDVLEELDHEALQLHNKSSSDSATSSSQVQDLLAQIQEITTRFVDIEEEKRDLGLKERPGVRSRIINKSLPTSSLVDSSQIVGREGHIEAILKLLDISATTKAGANENRVFGMGGWRSVINGYGGVTLPNWMGDSSYSKLVKLSLVDCKSCKSLPSLGQLPLLEEVKIERMLEIEAIGMELYGEASPHGRPFPSLKTLEFENMPKWVNWSLPVIITSLLHLKLGYCPELVVPELSVLPSLRELRFRGVKDISNGLHCPTSLTELYIDWCKNLRTLPDGIISSNSKLQVLEIKDCESLESFPSGVLPTTLKILSIRNCRKLEWIGEMLLGPASLDYIGFWDYPNLRSLPECLCTNLTFLMIDRCESIESFPEIGLPFSNLTHLRIRDCENLKYLPSNLRKLTSLRDLHVARDRLSLPADAFSNFSAIEGLFAFLLSNRADFEDLEWQL
ncbi:Rx, N-terminal [Dillenia turbinata]|uniref:Rx, N-terminal n=1 Tax=Dillenia turbinata TaxID=194707 RepID=A0AAN8V701_9MAGN